MDASDLFYICTAVANLAGIPVRVYENRVPCFYHCVIDLPADPIRLYEREILDVPGHVGYFATPEFDYYGIVSALPYQVVLGPTRQIENNVRELERLAFTLSVPSGKKDKFVQGMRSLIRFPLESLLQMLCTINFMLNQEKLSLSDIQVYGIGPGMDLPPQEDSVISENKSSEKYPYSGYDTEQQLMEIITRGDEATFLSWTRTAPAIRPGLLSADQLRQIKNLFIVSATLSSRAAVHGGLESETAFWMSDAYIRRCELLDNPSQIMALQYEMVLDYIRHVTGVRIGPSPTPLSLAAANYIQNHLTQVISVNDLSSALFLSRSRLSARLKAESGMSIVEMIQRIKIEEAKRLLRYTDRPISAISDYLAFSSQSHLTRVFEKYTGLSPAAYRRGN